MKSLKWRQASTERAEAPAALWTRVQSSRRARFAPSVLAGLAALWAVWAYGSQLDRVYAVRDWLFWRVALLWLYPAVLSVACTSFGFLIVSRLVELPPVLETLVLSMATGLVGFDLALYAGGALGWFHLWFAVALPLLLTAAGAPALWKYARKALADSAQEREQGDALSRLIRGGALVFGVIGAALVYLPLLTPEAIDFDAEWCHLTTAQDYALHGRIVPFVGDYARNVPQLASFIHTWGWLLPVPYPTQRWTLPLHTEFSIFLWTLAGVAAMTRFLLHDDMVKGAWATFFLFPAIFVYDSNLAGAADHFLAFFAIPLFLASARAIRRFEPGFCALAGLFGAGALLTKYQAIYPLAGAALILALGWSWHAGRLLRRAPSPVVSWRRLMLGALLVAGVGLATSAPHFIKNWVFYRDPVYPFGQDVFKHATPTVPHASYYVRHLLEDETWTPRGSTWQRLRDAAAIFGTFSFRPHYSLSKNWPIFGGLFTFSLPLLPFCRRSGRIWLGALAGSAGVLAWALVFRVDRNLQAFTPVLVATTAAILVAAWRLGSAARVPVVALVGLQLVWGGDAMLLSQKSRLDAAMRLITSGYDGRRHGERFDYRREYRRIDAALPAGSRTILHNLRQSLGIRHELWLDMPGQQAAVDYEGIRGPRELYDYYRRLHVTHLLHAPGARPAWAKHDDILFNALIAGSGARRHRFGAYELVELPARPPPPDARPWNVLTLALSGYRDGIYPVERMQVYEILPANLRRFPSPEPPLAGDAASIQRAFDRAACVVIGSRLEPRGLELQLLSRDFSIIARYRSHTIYLRRSKAPP